MKIKELIRELKKFDSEQEVIVSSDEELNTLYDGFKVAEYEDYSLQNRRVVIYPLSTKILDIQ